MEQEEGAVSMSKEKLTYSKESEKASHRGCHMQFGKKEEREDSGRAYGPVFDKASKEDRTWIRKLNYIYIAAVCARDFPGSPGLVLVLSEVRKLLDGHIDEA